MKSLLAPLMLVLAVVVQLLVAAPAVAACPAANGDAYSTAVLADAPLAYYRLDEAAGPTMCDSSSSHNNGTYNATGITYGVSGALLTSSDTGALGGGVAGVFGASDADSGISGNQSFTFEGWFRSTGTTPNEALVDVGQAGNGDIAGLTIWPTAGGCAVNGSSIGLDEFNGSNCWDTTTVGVHLLDQRWHYLALTYDAVADKVTAYVDGRSLGAQTPATSGGIFNLAASPVRVAVWVDSFVNQSFVGDADEIAVYPKPLSANRILIHYEAAGYRVGPPVAGKSVDAAPVSGTVLLRLPGKKRFTRLVAGARIPVGSTIDSTRGVVALTAAKDRKHRFESGQFYAGAFRVEQKRVGGGELTLLTLMGASPTKAACAAGVAVVARKKPRRKLWGSSSGGYGTVGADASATERGTKWLTEDTCAGTLIQVTKGSVTVDDFSHHRTFVLKAPHSFLAHPGKGG